MTGEGRGLGWICSETVLSDSVCSIGTVGTVGTVGTIGTIEFFFFLDIFGESFLGSLFFLLFLIGMTGEGRGLGCICSETVLSHSVCSIGMIGTTDFFFFLDIFGESFLGSRFFLLFLIGRTGEGRGLGCICSETVLSDSLCSIGTVGMVGETLFLSDNFREPSCKGKTALPSIRSFGTIYCKPKKSKIERSSGKIWETGDWEPIGVNPCSFKEYPFFKECPRITTLNPLLPVK